MSLINQVLKDVEARQAGEKSRADRVTPALRAETASIGWRIPVFIGGFVAAAGFAGWLLWSEGTAVPATAQVALAPEAAPAPKALSTAPPVSPAPKSEPAPKPTVTKAPEERPLVKKLPPVATGEPEPVKAVRATAASSETVGAGVKPDAPPATAATSETPLQANTPKAPPVMEKRVRRLTPEQKADRLYSEARTLLSRGQRSQAEDRLGKALEEYPPHTRAREAFAGLLISEGRWVELLPVVEKGLILNPSDGKLAQLAARAYLQQDRPDAAVTVLASSLEARPSDTSVAAFLAATYQKLGRYPESAELYRRLVIAHPRNNTWWAGLGVALEQTERPEEARSAYEKALSLGALKSELRDHIVRRLALLK